MLTGVKDLFQVVIAISIVVSLGAIISFFYYNIKKRDLFGGFIGGMVIGVIGALIGGFLFNDIILFLFDFLAKNQYFNAISGFLGAFLAVYIMNKLNHNKERKKY